MAETARIGEITATDWQMALGSLGEIESDLADIHQAIRIIIGTPRGSLAHRTEFGSEVWLFVDWPIAEARPRVIREVVDAVARFEPRVEVIRVTAERLPDADVGLLVRARWRLAGTETPENETAVEVAA